MMAAPRSRRRVVRLLDALDRAEHRKHRRMATGAVMAGLGAGPTFQRRQLDLCHEASRLTIALWAEWQAIPWAKWQAIR